MSGGLFEYKQYAIEDMIDSIEREIKHIDEYIQKESTDVRESVLEKLNLTIEKLKEAQIYAHRVDWFLSGDDSPSSFLTRLNEDLEKHNLKR